MTKQMSAVDIVTGTKLRDFTFDDDDVVVGVMLLVKVVDGSDAVGVAMSHDHTDWVTRVGMLDHVLEVERLGAAHRALAGSEDGDG